MKPFIHALLNNFVEARQTDRKATLLRKLKRHEAQIGGELFGKVPEGHHREFFCLDSHTWVWHEEWIDQTGQRQIVTTRYDVRPTTILKSQNGSHYTKVSLAEARRLRDAAALYRDRVTQEVYSFI